VTSPDGETPHERRDPAEDPRACSICGVYVGAFGGEYCDGCAREVGAKPPLQRCVGCGRDFPQERMDAFDVSAEDEYYPDLRYICPGCQSEGGGAGS